MIVARNVSRPTVCTSIVRTVLHRSAGQKQNSALCNRAMQSMRCASILNEETTESAGKHAGDADANTCSAYFVDVSRHVASDLAVSSDSIVRRVQGRV